VKEVRDVEVVGEHIAKTTYWDERLEASAKRAFSQKDFQAAIQKLEQLEKTADGKELKRDLKRLAKDLERYTVVSDVPSNIEKQLAPLQ
jgi:hypothetical protein